MDLKLSLDTNELQSFFEEARKIQKSCPSTLETKRLFRQREKTPDYVSTIYTISLREMEEKVGSIMLINDGTCKYSQPNGRLVVIAKKIE